MRLKSILLTLFALGISLHSKEYITRDQLESSRVVDLPGRLGGNYVRETDPENMTANAVSKLSELLVEHSSLTLGSIGGIAALGFMGVISAPVALIAGAAVGGLALTGALSDSNQSAAGHSTMNYGFSSHGRVPVYTSGRDSGVGLMSQVFGIRNPNDASYQVGSLGLSSSMRAPVHVNMQDAHVMNTYGRGYDFAAYDQGYVNGMSTDVYGMALSARPSFSGNAGPAASTSSFYDRRGGQTFSNFFQRTDGAGVQGSGYGYSGDSSVSRMWYQVQPYAANWRQTVYQPTNRLNTSWEYAPGGTWNMTSPQGRVFRQQAQPVSQGIQEPNFQTRYVQLEHENAYTSASSASSVQNNNLQDPMMVRFSTPQQSYDLGSAMSYPMGNGYTNAQIPANYNSNFHFQNQNLNFGYQPYAGVQTGMISYALPNQVLPGVLNATPTQIPQAAVFQQPILSGLTIPVTGYNPQSHSAVNQNSESVQTQAMQVNYQAELSSGSTVKSQLGSAMAPDSSKFDHTELARLEEERRQVYNELLQAMKTGNQEKQEDLFQRYQEFSTKIAELQR